MFPTNRLGIAASTALLAGTALVASEQSTFAALSATAEITTAQVSAPYNYTISLHNTGDTGIGTFWFAWTPPSHEYDFLPTIPSLISGPAGWLAPISHNAFPGDGYGIEWYNIAGSAIAPGGTGTFHFTSSDSPDVIAGDSFFPGFLVTHSVVYGGLPFSDPGYAFDGTVVIPSPTTVLLPACVAAASLSRRRRS